MARIVNDKALDTLFRSVRRPRSWRDQPISDTLLRALWELIKDSPNGDTDQQVRLCLAKSAAARHSFASSLSPIEWDRVQRAPVIAVVGIANPDGSALTGGALQAAFLPVAARALGLDCRVVDEFDRALVKDVCFCDAPLTPVLLCALGYGADAEADTGHSSPDFDEACRIL